MRARELATALAAGLACALLAPGCFALANLDRFDIHAPACTGNATITRDYHWNVTDLAPHRAQLFEMKVVDTTTRRVAAAVVYDPLPSTANPTLDGTLTDALAPGAYEARFWADLSMDGAFEVGPVDHAWIEPVPETGCFQFAHAGPFLADITPANDAGQGDIVLKLTGVGEFAGKPLIFRASDHLTEVGFYRLDAIPASATGAPPLTLPDLAVADATYTLEVFVDVDGDGLQGAGEPVFLPPQTSAAADAVFELDLGAP